MAAKSSRKRASAKKIKDKWKMKEWYAVHAPRMFENKVIAEALTSDPGSLPGRTVVTTLDALTGIAKGHVKLRFAVTGVSQKSATTTLRGHEMTSDYVRRLARRKKTKIDCVFDVATKDGVRVQLTVTCVADKRLQRSQEREVRMRCEREARAFAARNDLMSFIGDMLQGGLGKHLALRCRSIYPMRRVEVIKSEVYGGAERTIPDMHEEHGEVATPPEDEGPEEESPDENPPQER